YTIVGGNAYDEDGGFLGHLDAHGRMEFDQNLHPAQEAKDINSFFRSGWRFAGDENGRARSFDVAPSLSNGKIFLPVVDQTAGKRGVGDNGTPLPPTEFEVRLGMIINSATGSQYGRLIPPVESRETFEGGFIMVGGSPAPVSLTAFPGAVFDVALV